MTDGRPITIDTSVAVKWFFDEPYSGEALRLRRMFEEGIHYPLAPDLIYPEFANAIWKRVLFDGLDSEEGRAAINVFRALPFEIVPSIALLAAAYELSLRHKQSIYDTLFLALSLSADADLVTADEKFFRAVHPQFPKVGWLATWAPANWDH
jgi:predicted nucleic acid-binding protein